ncbi:DNA primase [Candidatus Kuenenbacteria bacterium HGW-Kuenenbacteria-1]|uniref:DNA primase n=1 Tax=Candidatus Kuenenbacteria bacterium HGW-Kuenenbacteria-1 TaxID=2013812 RepID=A0A2N1UN68_9BACT|nr:MAG: DNA primase [Candidatus Kuenenbacteria bacterium HGW-Kuenenbacteria-1]
MDNITDEIKSRLDIIDVIQEYLPQLKQAGVNWKTFCPFHNEKTPSFTVSREKQIWHCFGCSEGGDIFSFIMKIEGVEFVDALRILAKKANVVLKKQDPQLTSQRTILLDICQTASDFYHQILIKYSQGEIAREYLKERKISSNTAKDFQLGYAPNSWESLTKFLLNKNFKENELIESGLVIKSANTNMEYQIYDRFRNRLIFPIRDVYKNVIGFSGRILSENKEEAKYINTPQTLIYNKSHVLYGIEQAKQEIRKENLAVLVEGNMDVISSHQAGIKNVVACSGTALTLEQIKLLKRYSSNLALSFDVDLAGQEATKRGIDIAWQQEMNIKIIKFLKGKDPDECIRKDVNIWREAIQNSQSIMEYYFDFVFLNLDLTKIENKKNTAKILLPLIARLSNKIEQTHWLQKLGEFLNIDEQILRDLIIDKKNTNSNLKPELKEENKIDQDLLIEEKIVGLFLKFYENFKNLKFSFDILQNKELKELAKNFIREYTEKKKEFNENKWLKSISKEMADYFNKLIFLIEKDFSIFDSSIELEIQKNIRILKKNILTQELKIIEENFKKAEEKKDFNEINSLEKKFKEVIKQLNEIENN